MLGRLPWLAFERRRRALRFLVFFDMRDEAIGANPHNERPVQDLTQRARLSTYGVPSALVLEQTTGSPL